MNILIISRGTPSLHDPQWGNFEKEQAIALVNYGHQVIMMSINRKFRWKNWFGLEVKEDDGIKSYNLNLPPIFNERFVLTISLLQKFSLWLYRKILADGFEPDLIYSHYLNNSILGVSIKKQYNIPLVAIEHWSKITDMTLPYYIRLMGSIVYKNSDLVISVSKSLHKRIKKHFGRDSIIINNMVSSDFVYSTFKHDMNTQECHFVSIGSLIQRKGFDCLIKAFSQVVKIRKNVRLSIIGDGIEYDRLKDLISSNNADSYISLLGRKNKAEIVELLDESEAFILTSRSETFGVVYIEAMMMGLPVIATVCGGPEEFISHENGLLVDVDNIGEIVNAIIYLVDNIDKYDREKIADNCKKRFSSEVIVQQLNESFEAVLKIS